MAVFTGGESMKKASSPSLVVGPDPQKPDPLNFTEL
jgi:hypothetical protein